MTAHTVRLLTETGIRLVAAGHSPWKFAVCGNCEAEQAAMARHPVLLNRMEGAQGE
jgi:hypothetical protein